MVDRGGKRKRHKKLVPFFAGNLRFPASILHATLACNVQNATFFLTSTAQSERSLSSSAQKNKSEKKTKKKEEKKKKKKEEEKRRKKKKNMGKSKGTNHDVERQVLGSSTYTVATCSEAERPSGGAAFGLRPVCDSSRNTQQTCFSCFSRVCR